MSSEVIESVYKYSAINNKPLMLIASKNQIDHSSGYVNNWNTKQYSLFLKSLKKKYKNSNVKICRDHCGPGFNGNYSIKDVFDTIDSDIQNNFDLIHIDFSKTKTDYDKIIKLYKEAILYAKSLNLIGTAFIFKFNELLMIISSNLSGRFNLAINQLAFLDNHNIHCG